MIKEEKPSLEQLIESGYLKIGRNTRIDEDVWACHYLKDNSLRPVIIGDNCVIRSGTIIYIE